VGGTISAKEGKGRHRLSIVSVWSTQQGLVLGQLKAKGSGNAETAAVLELLDLINIEGLTIVGDAGIGGKSVINKIVTSGADYIFPVKSNSRSRFYELAAMLTNIAVKDSTSRRVGCHSTKDKGHGRNEQRFCTIIRRSEFSEQFLKSSADLNKVCTVGRIVYESREKETRPHIQTKDGYTAPPSKFRKKKETRYFISSLELSAQGMMEKLRLQWSIENKLHWVLDVSLGQDGNRTRNKIAAENLALVRKIALNLVNQDKKSKVGVKAKLKMAGWDNSYLETLLFRSSLA